MEQHGSRGGGGWVGGLVEEEGAVGWLQVGYASDCERL